jgi:hypothetical protein
MQRKRNERNIKEGRYRERKTIRHKKDMERKKEKKEKQKQSKERQGVLGRTYDLLSFNTTSTA